MGIWVCKKRKYISRSSGSVRFGGAGYLLRFQRGVWEAPLPGLAFLALVWVVVLCVRLDRLRARSVYEYLMAAAVCTYVDRDWPKNKIACMHTLEAAVLFLFYFPGYSKSGSSSRIYILRLTPPFSAGTWAVVCHPQGAPTLLREQAFARVCFCRVHVIAPGTTGEPSTIFNHELAGPPLIALSERSVRT